MLILGIESSCDETAAAVVEDGRRVLSNVIASQVEEHRKYGGVVPEIASRRHAEAISDVVRRALDEAGITLQDIDGIAVTYAPGLIASPLHFWMPKFITTRLQEGFKAFGRAYHGFLTNEANMIAIETRTSAPVRILRQRETLQHVRIRGLFPCGEGAGYAGGIVSAGVDGERCAEMAAEKSGKMILNSQE